VAFTGHPDRLVPAMAGMFRIKELASQLMRNPIPGTEWNAAPTFEMPGNN